MTGTGAAGGGAKKKGCSPPIIALLAGCGCLALLAFGGFAAAVLIPNFVEAVEMAKVKRTMSTMDLVGNRLEAYRVENGTYPEVTNLGGLKAALRDFLPADTDLLDGWQQPLAYACWSESSTFGCDTYRLVSVGKDGVAEQEDLRRYQAREVDRYDHDADLVLAPEGFLQRPAE